MKNLPKKSYQVCIAGASPDTGNLGVTALCYTTLNELHKRGITDITVLDHGKGRRMKQIDNHIVKLQGVINSRNIFKPESLWMIKMCCKIGRHFNSAAKTIISSDAVLDFSAEIVLLISMVKVVFKQSLGLKILF